MSAALHIFDSAHLCLAICAAGYQYVADIDMVIGSIEGGQVLGWCIGIGSVKQKKAISHC